MALMLIRRSIVEPDMLANSCWSGTLWQRQLHLYCFLSMGKVARYGKRSSPEVDSGCTQCFTACTTSLREKWGRRRAIQASVGCGGSAVQVRMSAVARCLRGSSHLVRPKRCRLADGAGETRGELCQSGNSRPNESAPKLASGTGDIVESRKAVHPFPRCGRATRG
jgi:hypothetical protein